MNLKEISGDICQKVAKIGKNTEGVLKLNTTKKSFFYDYKNKKVKNGIR
jgi:hypothetical protein